jgi:phosphoenolpyruvate carboxylase
LVGDLAAEQLSAPADGAEQTSAIAGNTGLLSNQPELSRTLGVRDTYLLPLHYLQVALLRQYRDRTRTTGRSGCPAGGVRRGRARACPAHHGQRDRGRRA